MSSNCELTILLNFVCVCIVTGNSVTDGKLTVQYEKFLQKRAYKNIKQIIKILHDSSFLNKRRKRTVQLEKLNEPIKEPLIDPENWGYNDNDGPNKWPEKCHSGKRQSPVNIELSKCTLNTVTPLNFVNYNTTFYNLTSKNIGHGVMVSGFRANGLNAAPYVYGGNLSERYYLEQFHFHWSIKFLNGSEHTINNHHHPVEIHLVHVKKGLTIEEAAKVDDGIAVMAVFLDLSDEGGSLESVAKTFEYIINEGSEMTAECTPSTILPNFTSLFFRYDGSLTTPPCAESVIWTVFFDSVPITIDQFKALRRIQIAGRAINDARPIQPLNDRYVRLCIGSLPCTPNNCSSLLTKSLNFASSASINGTAPHLTLILHAVLWILFFFSFQQPNLFNRKR